MTTRASTLVRTGEFAAVACMATMAMSWVWVSPADAATPGVAISPTGALHDGETVSVSVPANSLFTPHSGVHILECADPGGTQSNLPKDVSTCDGNTIQADSVLVNSDGSFSETHYVVYALPSATLGEQSNFQPVCNAANPCVLYVGQDQNDFTAPKVFSAPFSIGPGTGGSGANSAGTSTTSSPNAATGAGSTVRATGALAKTGAPGALFWMTAAGALLIVGGAVGRRAQSRTRS
jgi:hypothetical protein